MPTFLPGIGTPLLCSPISNNCWILVVFLTVRNFIQRLLLLGLYDLDLCYVGAKEDQKVCMSSIPEPSDYLEVSYVLSAECEMGLGSG